MKKLLTIILILSVSTIYSQQIYWQDCKPTTEYGSDVETAPAQCEMLGAQTMPCQPYLIRVGRYSYIPELYPNEDIIAITFSPTDMRYYYNKIYNSIESAREDVIFLHEAGYCDAYPVVFPFAYTYSFCKIDLK